MAAWQCKPARTECPELNGEQKSYKKPEMGLSTVILTDVDKGVSECGGLAEKV